MRAKLLLESAAFWLRQEHAVRERENLRCRSVVGLDAVNLRARMAIGKREDVFDVCATPGVDALRVVAYGHDAMMRTDEIDDLRLQDVGVLVFVDEDVPKTMGEVRGGVGRFLEQVEPVLEEIVVVEDVGLALLL